ncbi:TetR family transcriptional regulator [Cupriavidus necator]|uniref:TetR/AcrR family transcriptional regulator n=1 Tax=Cupriavidus necator TaxID=106590 RepID=UPI003ECD4ED5
MARRTREDAAATRARILAAAGQLVQARGVHAVTLDDVARAIGMTRGAVYGHFRSRADLLGALLDLAEHDIAARLAAVASASPFRLDAILAAVLDGDGLARHASLLSALLQHKCSDACELCPLRLRIRAQAERLRELVAVRIADPVHAHLLVAHLWGLLSAQSLHLASGGLSQWAAPLGRLYAHVPLRDCN